MTEVQTERELKLALEDASQLSALLASLPPATAEVTQRNVYFADPDGRTLAAQVMVRVRESREGPGDPTVTLTVKRRLSRREGVFVSEEREMEVPWLRWEALGAERSDPMTLDAAPLETLRVDLGVQRLVCLGIMRNRRVQVPMGDFLLEIDRTEFPDGSVDAEVEVETVDPEGARALLLDQGRRAGVQLTPQASSKFLRFLIRTGQLPA